MTKPTDTASQLEPAIIVVFGVTGDLAQRYLLPALYHLFKEQLLHEHTQIIGLTRQDMTVDELFGKVELCINEADKLCDPVAIKNMRDHSQLLKFDPSVSADYQALAKELTNIEATHGVCMNRLYYLSIPPDLFATTVQNLGKANLEAGCEHGVGKARLLVEKPFGANYASAEQLITTTNEVFHEAQVFRIDHYLAKETVQNILTFRRSNPVFASIWDGQHITSIDILASEKIGIEGRVNFYEGVGALRDLIQSHLLQLLGVVTMHLPAELTSDSIHASKQAVLADVQTADPATAIRGQYDSYRTEVKNDQSTTETYAKLHLAIDNEQWRDVPISIATGKALIDKRTEVRVTFTDKRTSSDAVNILTFRIQPDEGIDLELRVKKPGYQDDLQDAALSFNYQQTFGNDGHPNAYERVLVDAVKGDRTLFATSEEVLQSWRIIEPVLEAWKESADTLQSYPSGSGGF